ncbi:MAG: TatD family hydrolase [Acidobacteriota bacterium]
MIDSHAHVSMFEEGERAGVLGRATAAGVSRILAPATGPDDLDAVLELAAVWPERIVVAIGVHPHEARHLGPALKRRIEAAVRAPGVVAVGEIGLDYHYDHSPRDEQRRALSWQLGLAIETGLPAVFHHREAWADFLALLDGFPGVRGVAHSFTEGSAGAVEMNARGLMVGISGMVTFPRADNIREAAAAVREGWLLVETDSPYLAPVPHRGRRNEPAYVRLVAEEVARVRGVPPADLERQTDDAFSRLFRVSDSRGA